MNKYKFLIYFILENNILNVIIYFDLFIMLLIVKYPETKPIKINIPARIMDTIFFHDFKGYSFPFT